MKRVRFPRLVLVCLLMVSAIATARVLSQQPPPSPQAPQSQPGQPQQGQAPPGQAQPTFRVGATYVRVDAYVTQDGKPVTDLKPEDFEVYEDGVRQTIRNFELVSVPQGNLQTTARTDPRTVAEMRERVADPRRRVFVLFLDTYNSQLGSSMSARKAFKKFVEELVGPDDLIAGMTPEMSPEALTFGSRTEALDSFLDSIWGRRDSIRQDNEEEFMQGCFSRPDLVPLWPLYKARRRTKLTLDAVEALVQHVGDLRDERKAIITVSEGWALYAEDDSLMNKQDPNGTRPLHTGPVVKRPIERDTNPTNGECDAVFLQLSQMETIHQFRDLPDKANRANASFYLIDPRGLPASDDLLNATSLQADFTMLRNKQENMRELANRTDGMAFYQSNDLNAELKKISQDLSSYYLFGYDSTNGKLDGTYRALSVKVKRPGVQVRARKGYRAATLPAAGSSNSRSGGTPNSPAGNEIESAIGSIMSTRADLPVRLRATAVRLLDTTANGQAPHASELRVIAEVDPKLAMSDAWRQGGTAHFIIRGEGSDAPISTDVPLKPGERVLTGSIALPAGVTMGDFRVQMRLNAQSHTDALSDSTTVHVAAPGLIATPALLRRGPSTGIAYVPTADVRFRRADRLRLEALSRLPGDQVKVTAVDLRGQPLTLPITVTDRPEGGATLIVADISLAPLAPGGYAIVLTPNTTQERVIVPFQLIP